MGFESNTGLNVNNHYGERETGQTSGNIRTAGVKNELSIQVDAKDIGVALFNAPVIPAGSLIVGAYVKVEEAFALGGTTPTIDIGTSGSVATNNVEVSEAQAEAAGTYDIFSSAKGTWAASLAADTTVAIELGGTTPTKTDAGSLEVVIEYVKVEV